MQKNVMVLSLVVNIVRATFSCT